MSAYSTYKPSGVVWLGDIPEHWEIKRLKLIGQNVGGLTYSPEDVLADESGTLVLRSSNIQNGKFSGHDNVFVDIEISTKQTTYVDDILLCARNGSASLVGKNILIDDETSGFSFGAFMSVFRSKSNRFIYWFFNSPIFSAQKGLFSTTTINQLTSGILYGMFTALPPAEEQTAIANYLDEKTKKLDHLIKNKKAQIKKIKEIRQIEINHAVTQGLNPNVALKPSGIEWLGDVPKHWKVKRVKDNVRLNICSLGSDANAELEINYLDIANVNNTGITGEIQKLKFFEAPSRARRIVQNGDVIMSTVRPYLKAIAYLENIPKNMIVSTGFAVMTTRINYNSKYLFYQTVSDWFNETINSKSVGASYPALNSDVLVATNILVPPSVEQTAIANYLDEKTAKLDQLISNLENQINQLQEIRKIEIYNAVTGKIKVA